MKLFYKAALGLYRMAQKGNDKIFHNHQVETDLDRLNPGTDKTLRCEIYYVEKLEKSFFILAVGMILAVGLAIRAKSESRLGEAMRLARKDAMIAQQPAELVKIGVKLDGKTEVFQIPVQPRQLAQSEADELAELFAEQLEEMILGRNESLGQVKSDLNLLETYEGFPFSVEWQSSDSEVLSSAGKVLLPRTVTEVNLQAIFRYEDWEWEKIFVVKVCAEELDAEEERRRELSELLLHSEEDSRGDNYWSLPGEYKGQSLNWRKIGDDFSLWIGLGSVVVAVAVYYLTDHDLHEKREKQKLCMQREYPDIVHKLVLYIGAGMTLRGAFQKVASEYEQGKNKGKPLRPAYEEMLYTCRELQAGVSEAKAYEHFGRRSGLQEYIRLSTLFSQNLKRGSGTLLDRLREEAARASAEKIQSSRRLGEEASTKLLIPMVMMLAVVMVIIMIPAFSTMGL